MGTRCVPDTQKLADSFSEGAFQLLLTQLHLIEPAYKLTVANYDCQANFKRNLLLSAVAHQYTALITLPDHSMPPMEADTTYQGCLPSSEIHSKSHSLSGVHSKFIDCAHVVIMQSGHMCYANSQIAQNKCIHVEQQV